MKRPVVICLGIGSNLGSHDGYSIFEEYLVEMANLPGVCICVAAGNESQARHHTQGVIQAKNESQNIDVKVTEESSDMELLKSYLPFWEQLSEPQKDLLNSAVHERRFSKGDLLHSGSADCIGLLLVTGGQLRAYMVSEEGKELTLYRLLNRDLCLFSASCIMRIW